MQEYSDEGAAKLHILDWDSNHYSRTVARIEGEPDDEALKSLLERAEQQHVALLYWRAPKERQVPRALLDRFAGSRVSGYLCLQRDLERPGRPVRPAPGYKLTVYDGPEGDPDLLALAVAAGRHSRFRADPQLDAERCDAMYQIWIRRCVRGEMADEVLVALQADRPCALVTIAVEGALAQLGLVATIEAHRGRGLGSALLSFAHQRMRQRGAVRAEVATQAENEPALRLYSRSGYEVLTEADFYHFHIGT